MKDRKLEIKYTEDNLQKKKAVKKNRYMLMDKAKCSVRNFLFRN